MSTKIVEKAESSKHASSFISKRKLLMVFIAVQALGCLMTLHTFYSWAVHSNVRSNEKLFQCQTYEKVEGASHKALDYIFNDVKFINETVGKLQRLVRIPTEITDDHPDPGTHKDIELYKPFFALHEQIEKEFPLVWSKLKVEKVNNLALVVTWEGSDKSLKPAMFAAHQDVVPVDRNTWDSWKFPPFSGHIEYNSEDVLKSVIWGRGSFDDKNFLVSELQALELLLSQGFKPKRTIIMAFGCDEEVGGQYGATKINEFLIQRYGENGIYSIVDEGLNGIKRQEGVYIASPGTAEKGFINFWAHLNTPGGHSSVPPPHTGIGIVADLIHRIESRKFPITFTEKNPVTEWYQCAAQYSTEIDKDIQFHFLNAMNDKKSNERVIEYLLETGGRKIEYLLRTSQAVDIINGGIKANALPETVSVLVNSRVSLESSVNQTMEEFLHFVKEVCHEYSLGLEYDGVQLIEPTTNGTFSIELALTKEPVSPSPKNEVWELFAGAVKSLYEDVVFPAKFGDNAPDQLVISPTIMSGNTDCMSYLSLTENIYRFQPGFHDPDTLGTIHSVNEHIDFDTIMNTLAFIYHYIHAVQ